MQIKLTKILEITKDREGGIERIMSMQSLSVRVSVADGAVLPYLLGAAVDVSADNVWITNCTTVSIRSGKSMNIPLLCLLSIHGYQLLIGLCMFCVIPLHFSDGLRRILIICPLYYCQLRGFSLSAFTSNDSHYQGINSGLELGQMPYLQDHGLSDSGKLGGRRYTWSSEARVDEDASAGNKSTSTSREVSVGAALLLSSSSRSWGTPAHRHNSVFRIGKGRDVCVDPLFGHDRTKENRLRMTQNGLIIGWHDCATDEAKPVMGGDVHIPLLNQSSRTQPPRGDFQNLWR
ncbi:hypothetical protein H5410_021433 [Solanum commersonii]|uniref:Uncharacterized protein n=1 Tax=Solanum commersonii TaxID=4109 RepID=A0A9J5ZE89_SOLCO|nr:hypothetical protein H5410_021433 [Solanum commersonii]